MKLNDIVFLGNHKAFLRAFAEQLSWVCEPGKGRSVQMSFDIFDISTKLDDGNSLAIALRYVAEKCQVEVDLFVSGSIDPELNQEVLRLNLPKLTVRTFVDGGKLRPSVAVFRRGGEVRGIFGGVVAHPEEWKRTPRRAVLFQTQKATILTELWSKLTAGSTNHPVISTREDPDLRLMSGAQCIDSIRRTIHATRHSLLLENISFSNLKRSDWADVRNTLQDRLSRHNLQVKWIVPFREHSIAEHADIYAELAITSRGCIGVIRRDDRTFVPIPLDDSTRKGRVLRELKTSNRFADIAKIVYDPTDKRAARLEVFTPIRFEKPKYVFELAQEVVYRFVLVVSDEETVVLNLSEDPSHPLAALWVKNKEFAKSALDGLELERVAHFPLAPLDFKSWQTRLPHADWLIYRTAAARDGRRIPRSWDDTPSNVIFGEMAGDAFDVRVDPSIDLNHRSAARYRELAIACAMMEARRGATLARSPTFNMSFLTGTDRMVAEKTLKRLVEERDLLAKRLRRFAEYDPDNVGQLLQITRAPYHWNLGEVEGLTEGLALAEDESLIQAIEDLDHASEEGSSSDEESDDEDRSLMLSARGSASSAPTQDVRDTSNSDGGGWKRVFTPSASFTGRRKTLRVPVYQLDRQGQIVKELQPHELTNSTFQSRTKGRVALARFRLPDNLHHGAREIFLRHEVVHAKTGMRYRLDVYDTGSSEYAWGVGAGGNEMQALLPFQESVAYSRQALLASYIAGCTGTVECYLVPEGKYELVLGDGTRLIPYDGFGFLNGRMAREQMKLIDARYKVQSRIRVESTLLAKDALPNTQMLQWLNENEPTVVELAESTLRKLGRLRAEGSGTNSLQNNDENDLYRTVTCGGFPVKYGLAVPVPGDRVVLPGIQLSPGVRVALHRSPADKPNWALAEAGGAPKVDEFLSRMITVQYRLTRAEPGGHEEREAAVFFKGLLGIIPEDLWPKELGTTDVLVCATDQKLNSNWKTAGDVAVTKKINEPKFVSVTGTFGISKVFAPGATIGVPPEVMKIMSGDFDGDAVHVLMADTAPNLFESIQGQPIRSNPKLDKTFTPRDGDSVAKRLTESAEADLLVGGWSVIADLLCATHPDSRPSIAKELGRLIDIELKDVDEMWQLVGLGIKAGTDLAKTSLANQVFREKRIDVKILEGWKKKILHYLRRTRGFDNPHRTRNKGGIVADLLNGQEISSIANARAGQYGFPARIMRIVNESQRAQIMGRSPEDLHVTPPIDPILTRKGIANVQEIRLLNVPVARLPHLLIGKLSETLLASNRKTRNEDADRWVLRALASQQKWSKDATSASALSNGIVSEWLKFWTMTTERHERTVVAAGAKLKSSSSGVNSERELEDAVTGRRDLETIVRLLEIKSRPNDGLLERAAQLLATKRVPLDDVRSVVQRFSAWEIGKESPIFQALTRKLQPLQRAEMEKDLTGGAITT